VTKLGGKKEVKGMAGKDPIFQKVREIIAEQLSIDDEDEISLDSTFINDLGADSLDIVELIMALEEEFGLEIPDEDAEKINTVADVVEYIREKTK